MWKTAFNVEQNSYAKVIYLPSSTQGLPLNKYHDLVLINHYHIILFFFKPYLWNKARYNKSFSYDQREFQYFTKSRTVISTEPDNTLCHKKVKCRSF